jgi:hypothetical protein
MNFEKAAVPATFAAGGLATGWESCMAESVA